MIRHMVFVRFRAEVPAAARQALLADLGDLRARLGGILDFQARANISPETPLARGFDEMFWFDFATEADRDTYLQDEEHRALGARLVASAEAGPDGLFVCDIEL